MKRIILFIIAAITTCAATLARPDVSWLELSEQMAMRSDVPPESPLMSWQNPDMDLMKDVTILPSESRIWSLDATCKQGASFELVIMVHKAEHFRTAQVNLSLPNGILPVYDENGKPVASAGESFPPISDNDFLTGIRVDTKEVVLALQGDKETWHQVPNGDYVLFTVPLTVSENAALGENVLEITYMCLYDYDDGSIKLDIPSTYESTITVHAADGIIDPSLYTVHLDDGMVNGSVEANPIQAEAGDPVTLTISPNSGYKLATLEVKDAVGAPVEYQLGATEFIYTFNMPASDVYVSATFEEEGEVPPMPEYKAPTILINGETPAASYKESELPLTLSIADNNGVESPRFAYSVNHDVTQISSFYQSTPFELKLGDDAVLDLVLGSNTIQVWEVVDWDNNIAAPVASVTFTVEPSSSITVYCKADVAPYLYVWEMGTNSQLNGSWPGSLMTQTTVKNGETYWCRTFDNAGINLIFNNGAGSQTGDFTNITRDCYFIYNGGSFAYGAIPPEAFSSSKYYVFYVNTDRWSDVSVDLYTSASSYSRHRMTLLGHDLAGFEVYVWEAEELAAIPSQLKFTNGSLYTPIADFVNGGYYVYTFYLQKTVEQLDCVAVMNPDDESQRPQLLDLALDASANSAAVWNDLEASKQFTVSGTYFNKYDRNANLLYSVDGGEWTSLTTLTSDNTFSKTFNVRFAAATVYEYDWNGDGNVEAMSMSDLNGDGVVDREDFIEYLNNGDWLWDLDGDGVITIADYNVLQYGVDEGWISVRSGNDVHSLRIAAQDISGTFSTIHERVYYDVTPLSLEVDEVSFTGSAVTLSDATLVSDGGEVFIQGEHFTLSDYANNVNAGTATVVVSGIPGGVLGTARKSFVISPASLLGTVALVDEADAEVTYNGSAFEPAVTVTHPQYGVLEAGKDYTLSYADNIKPGLATITATGKGNYSGELSTTFTIVKASLPDGLMTVLMPSDILYDGEEHPATLTMSSGEYELLTDLGEIKEGVGYLLVGNGYKYVMGPNTGRYASALSVSPKDNGRIALTDEMAIIDFTISDGRYALHTAEGYMASLSSGNGVSYSASPVYTSISINDQSTSEVSIQTDDRILSFNNGAPRWCFYRLKQGENYLFKPVASDSGDLAESGVGAATITYVNTDAGTSSTSAPVEPGTYVVNVAFAEGECYLAGAKENIATFTIYALDEGDWASIKALYTATDGANWAKTIDVSDVKHARQLVDQGLATISHGRVLELKLANNSLDGTLPTSGITFTSLTSLDISNNSLKGNVGAFVVQMPSLVTLKANNNKLTDVVPALPSGITSLNLKNQAIDLQLDIDLSNLDIEALAASLPTILFYYNITHDYSWTPWLKISDGNGWYVTMAGTGTNWDVVRYSSPALYYGNSGDVLAVSQEDGDAQGSTFAVKLSFPMGDSDFNGAVNVVDLQAIINQIFDEYGRPFNWTAANVIVDDKLNVQDVVGEVNLLLSSASAGIRPRRAPQVDDEAVDTAVDAYLYWRDGVLYLSSSKAVSAMDIVLDGEATWDVSRYGLTVGNRGNHTVLYSLSGGAIPAGVTAIATTRELMTAVCGAMLSDANAREVRVSLSDPDVTGVRPVVVDGARVTVEGDAIVLEASSLLGEARWAVASIDGKVIASGEGAMEAGRTVLVRGVGAGAYVVSVTGRGGKAVRCKVLVR